MDPAREFHSSYRYTTNPIGFLDLNGLAELRVALFMKEYSQNPKMVDNLQAYYGQFVKKGDNLKMEAFDGNSIDNMLSFLKSGDKAALLAHGSPNDGNVYDNKGGTISFESLNKGMTSLLKDMTLFVDACWAKENLAVPEGGVNPTPNLQAAEGASGLHKVGPGAMKSLGVEVPEKK